MSIDAKRYKWLREYLISSRVDLDEAIVAATTNEELDAVVDKALVAVSLPSLVARVKRMNEWKDVDKSLWPIVLMAIRTKKPVDSNWGTHCYNTVYNIDGNLYDLTYELGTIGEYPCSITMKAT